MKRFLFSLRPGLLIALIIGNELMAQNASTQPGTSTPTSAPAQAASAPATGTVCIEAEIFAYKSLASNSDQIASEVAGLIRSAARPARTASAPALPADPGVLIVPSVTTILPAFQAWRSNMLLIQNLLNQAAGLPLSPASGCPTPAETAKAPSFAAYATGVGQAVGVVQSILSLFANNESITQYPGTIQDQALISGIARQLRAGHAQVLAPDVFAPWSIDIATSADSPFISKLGELITTLLRLQNLYQCNQLILISATQLQQAETTRAADFAKLTDSGLTPANRTALIGEIRSLKAQIDYFRQKFGLDISLAEIATPEKDTMETEFSILINAASSDAQKADALAKIRRNDAAIGSRENPLATAATLAAAKVQALVTGIQGYLAGLTGGAVSIPTATAPTTAAAAPAPAAGATPSNPSAAQTPVPATSPTASTGAPPTPPILAVLQADGLARRMNVPAGDRAKWDFHSWRILWVKSMESGGSITMTSNIFGSHPHVSGGAISAYALFQLDGTLVCSGNVGAYGGYIEPKDFVGAHAAAAVQMIPLGPGCGAEGQ